MTMSPDYFRQVYSTAPDPYGLADRWYETRKYAMTTALLPRPRYGTAFEPGCSVGVLTALLAPRCGRLLACDAIPDAVTAARARTASFPGVQVEQRVIPRDWPTQAFDLVVLSELLYYFDDADLDELLGRAVGSLRTDGQLLAVHWRHPAPDYPRTGDNVHEVLAARAGLSRLARYQDPDFTAEVYGRSDGDLRSVAQAGGIV